MAIITVIGCALSRLSCGQRAHREVKKRAFVREGRYSSSMYFYKVVSPLKMYFYKVISPVLPLAAHFVGKLRLGVFAGTRLAERTKS